MTEEELEKEATNYANKWLEEVKDLELYHNKTDPKPKYIRIKEAYLAGAEPREKQIQIDAEQIRALQKQNGELTDKVKELEAQIEKMKSQYDYAFNQLCESREILCSMLSQYKDRKEIDYSTRECGEKLLKEEVYKK